MFDTVQRVEPKTQHMHQQDTIQGIVKINKNF